MGTVFRITNTLGMKSGVARDSAVNVHHVYWDHPGVLDDDATFQLWAELMHEFYSSCSAYLSTSVASAGLPHKVTIARVSTNLFGAADDAVSPIMWEGNYNLLTATSATGLPPEVAICISHMGNVVGVPESSGGGRPRSRRRGRFYFGPLSGGSLLAIDPTSGRIDISVGAQLALINAFEAMAVGFAANPTADRAVSYGVYSPTADAFYSTDVAWVDNAFDTIRRRGIASSFRTTRNIDQAINYEGQVIDEAA